MYFSDYQVFGLGYSKTAGSLTILLNHWMSCKGLNQSEPLIMTILRKCHMSIVA